MTDASLDSFWKHPPSTGTHMGQTGLQKTLDNVNCANKNMNIKLEYKTINNMTHSANEVQLPPNTKKTEQSNKSF